jgi:hypothetical protein
VLAGSRRHAEMASLVAIATYGVIRAHRGAAICDAEGFDGARRGA